MLYGPNAALNIAFGCPSLLAWDLRGCQLSLRQMDRLMMRRPHVAMMSSGKPVFLASERSFVLFEGDEVPLSRMTLHLYMEALVSTALLKIE